MKAILRSYLSEDQIIDKVVEIDDDHDFNDGPYVDTIPFAVGSQQNILPLDWIRREYLSQPDLYTEEVIQQYLRENDEIAVDKH